MQIHLHTTPAGPVAEIQSDKVELTAASAAEVIANCYYQGAERVVVYERNIDPAFFDLKTGVAGEVLQKVSNYRMRLAIEGDFGKFESQSLRDFIYESNKGGRVCFVPTLEAALEALK